METKICTKCKKEYSIDEFNWRNKQKGTKRSECKYCHSDYMKNHYQEKKKIVNEIKIELSCQKCGESRFYCLDFHHLDPNIKDTSIARMLSNRSNIETVKDEIKKCIVLCSNCHREFHYLEREKEISIQEYLS